jgi:DMSO/TMAO reductase YedYZ molybdopterin-dependent catalytic subunit
MRRVMDNTLINIGKVITRRLFLKAAASFGAVLAFPRMVWSFFVKEMQTRTVETEAFVFDPIDGTIRWNGRPAVKEPYVLMVEGLVNKPQRFSYKALQAFPQITQASDFHCVEGWSVKDMQWGGIRFTEIVKSVQPKPEARYVIFHSLGKTSEAADGVNHYVESLPLQTLLDPAKKCLLALTLDGKPLSHDRGSPLRVVSPYDLGYKGSKFVTRIVFSKDQTPGWWTIANPVYPVDAPVPAKRLRGL